jgi:hypothetical protein
MPSLWYFNSIPSSLAQCDDCGIVGPSICHACRSNDKKATIAQFKQFGSTFDAIVTSTVVCGRTDIKDRSAYLCLPCAKKRRIAYG